MASEIELELIEEYDLMGEKRFRFLIKGTNIVINVSAPSLEQARVKAAQIARDVGVDKVLEILRRQEAK